MYPELATTAEGGRGKAFCSAAMLGKGKGVCVLSVMQTVVCLLKDSVDLIVGWCWERLCFV